MNASPSSIRRIRTAAAALAGLVAAMGMPARGGEEPGPVPLLRDVAAPDADRTGAQPVVAPAGIGDWRIVAALGATFAVLVGARMAAARRVSPPPPDVFELLGTATLGGQHAVRIVRFGPKTLLVGVSAAGATTLAEIADAQATARIATACRGHQRPAREPRPSAAASPADGRSVAAKEVA